jgi:hypothetical protein
MANPVVDVRWPGKVVDLLNQLRGGSGEMHKGWCGGGNMPEGWCVDFVAACCGVPEIGVGGVQLWNLWAREEFNDEGLAPGEEYDQSFLSWLDGQLRTTHKEPPILINTWLPPVAHQGGANLCRLVYPPYPAIWVEFPGVS